MYLCAPLTHISALSSADAKAATRNPHQHGRGWIDSGDSDHGGDGDGDGDHGGDSCDGGDGDCDDDDTCLWSKYFTVEMAMVIMKVDIMFMTCYGGEGVLRW